MPDVRLRFLVGSGRPSVLMRLSALGSGLLYHITMIKLNLLLKGSGERCVRDHYGPHQPLCPSAPSYKRLYSLIGDAVLPTAP